MKIVKQKIRIESDLDGVAILKKLERLARTCTRTEHLITDTSYKPFMQSIVNKGHWGVLEHHYFTIHGTASKAIQAQLFRHRHLSILAESTRYVNYTKNKNAELSFVMPYGYSQDDINFKTFSQSVENNYNIAIKKGINPEIARDILPLALATDFVATGNIRTWREILKQRNDKHADPQMIELAQMIEQQLISFVPIVFEGIHE